jgi:hypothetical protein
MQEFTVTLEKAILLYGKPMVVTKRLALELWNQRNPRLASLIVDDEMMSARFAYEDRDLPSGNDLSELDREPPSADYQWIVPGYKVVNVTDHLVFRQPLPEDIRIVGIDFNLLDSDQEVDEIPPELTCGTRRFKVELGVAWAHGKGFGEWDTRAIRGVEASVNVTPEELYRLALAKFKSEPRANCAGTWLYHWEIDEEA